MRLTDFADVHPNWNTVEGFDAVETNALLEMLVLTILIDGEVTLEERQTLIDEFARLPSTSVDGDGIRALFKTTEERLDKLSKDPELVGPYLDRLCGGIEKEEHKVAALRMLAIVALADGFDTAELDLLRGIGAHLDLSNDTTEDILRAVWESRQAHVAETNPDIDRDPKLVRSARHFEEHDMDPHNRPFSYDQRHA